MRNEKTKLPCLESKTYSFVAQVTKLEVVRVPDSLRGHSFLFNSVHFGFQKSKYFAHLFEESKFQKITGDFFKEKVRKEETDLSCLRLLTRFFIASLTKLEAVKVSNSLRNWLDQKVSRMHERDSIFEYFIHSAMSVLSRNRNMFGEKSQELKQFRRKSPEFDFSG